MNKRQHSDSAAWEVYLANARAIAAAYKAKAATAKPDDHDGYIMVGSDIIMSAVNDIMTYMSYPRLSPALSPEERSTLLGKADAVGIAKGTYREGFPDIW